MSGPLIFATTATIKPRRLGDYKQFATQLIASFKAREPQLIAMHVFLNE